MLMNRLLCLMAEKKASDLFLAAGSPVHLKINGASVPINQQRLDSRAITAMIRELVSDRQWQQFEQEHELNVGYGVRDVGSFRINIFKQRGTPACVIRYIPGDIPAFASLGLPTTLLDVVMEKRGLVLVVGATGSGKSTTLAAMLDHRNAMRSGHILTLEDPIEFTFINKRSIVNQRQIGTDTENLRVALKNAMRQAPDCILIGEIRDVETMGHALAYAQSGHLVLATLHANNANNALNRIVNFYPPDNRRVLLSDLAASLKAVISQRLIRAADGGRIPAVELLLNTRHVAELIEQGRLGDVKEAMEKSLAQGSQTFEQALVRLVHEQRIGREDALANSDSPTNLLWMLENTGGGGMVAAAEPPRTSEPKAAAPGLPSLDTAPINRPPAAAPAPAATIAPTQESPSFSEFLLNV
ncbi:MAG: PilT/PilU family type 4a pilus ATPase [Burkholderiaceae bacterium]